MKKIRNKVLQKIADLIINKLRKTTKRVYFDILFDLGMSYNRYCIKKFNLNLE
jgi:hypothetical protein